MSDAPDAAPTPGGLRAVLMGQTDSTLVQLVRYVFVGGLAFVVDFGSLIALTELAGLDYLVSAAIAFLLGLLTNYVLSIAWVFSKRNVGSPWAEFAVFAVIGVVGLGMNELILWGLTGGLGLYYPVSKLVSTAVVFGWNFGARKLALFS